MAAGAFKPTNPHVDEMAILAAGLNHKYRQKGLYFGLYGNNSQFHIRFHPPPQGIRRVIVFCLHYIDEPRGAGQANRWSVIEVAMDKQVIYVFDACWNDLAPFSVPHKGWVKDMLESANLWEMVGKPIYDTSLKATNKMHETGLFACVWAEYRSNGSWPTTLDKGATLGGMEWKPNPQECGLYTGPDEHTATWRKVLEWWFASLLRYGEFGRD